jgi:hypothetical protein
MESETEEFAASAKELPASRRKCALFTTLRMVKVNPLLGPWTSVLSLFDRTSGEIRGHHAGRTVTVAKLG